MNLIKEVYGIFLTEKQRINFKNFRRKSISFLYKGNKVTCNCCGKSFKYFLPFGDLKKRPNALCPWCFSLERTRLLWYFLKNTDVLKTHNTILHFAPAKFIEEKLKNQKHLTYLSTDINPNLAMDVSDITKLKYESNSFDLIICGHVLSVVKEEKKAFEELYRVLKKDGILILLECIYNNEITIEDTSIDTDEERIKLYGQPYLERKYGKDFVKRIKEKQFSVSIYNPAEELTEDALERYGMQNGDVLFLCKK